MHAGDQQRHAEPRLHQSLRSLVRPVGIVGAAKAKVDRHEHQPSAVRNRYREGPQREPRWRDPGEHTRMPSPEQQDNAEAYYERACASLDFALPCEYGGEHGKRHHHQKDCQHMSGREIEKSGEERMRAPLHQGVRHRKRPSHRGIGTVIATACDDREPEAGLRPAAAQVPTDG